jgi:hypothetical protein
MDFHEVAPAGEARLDPLSRGAVQDASRYVEIMLARRDVQAAPAAADELLARRSALRCSRAGGSGEAASMGHSVPFWSQSRSIDRHGHSPFRRPCQDYSRR